MPSVRILPLMTLAALLTTVGLRPAHGLDAETQALEQAALCQAMPYRCPDGGVAPVPPRPATATRDRHAATDCAALLPGMASVMQTMRQSQSLTRDQEATWRVWNSRCTDATWQQQLAATAPPLPPQVDYNTPEARARAAQREREQPQDRRGFWTKVLDAAVESHRYGPRITYTSCIRLRSGLSCTSSTW